MNCTQQTDSFITGERGGEGREREPEGGKAERRDGGRTKRNVRTEREDEDEDERWEEWEADGERMKERKVSVKRVGERDNGLKGG